MREATGTVLIVFAYICIATFLWKIIWRIIILGQTSENQKVQHAGSVHSPVKLFFKSAADILFLTRLLRTNSLLWFGEWVFHIAFIFVILRHLRYFLHPVPAWVVDIQLAGLCAGYVLPFSLLFILFIKTFIEKKQYFSSSNFFLLALLFLISITGIVMKIFIRPDIVEIKSFMISLFLFQLSMSPESVMFVIHFILSMIFLACLPSHIFAAPFTLLEARKREEEHGGIIHEK